MHWTKEHSKNAVEARRRKRMAEVDYDEPQTKCFKPRLPKSEFIIRIEDRFGERVQVSFNRFMGRVRSSEGLSARQFCRGLEQLLTKSA